MVCHGELARDRPATRHLTEYFLWMSFGGVVGGLFNGLVAPLAFNSLLEYPLVMMVACLMLPPLGAVSRDNLWARRADLALAGVFVLVGGLLLYMFYRDKGVSIDRDGLRNAPWRWALFGLAGGLLLGLAAMRTGWGLPPASDGGEPDNNPIDRALDLVLPAALLVLVVGLFWRLP